MLATFASRIIYLIATFVMMVFSCALSTYCLADEVTFVAWNVNGNGSEKTAVAFLLGADLPKADVYLILEANREHLLDYYKAITEKHGHHYGAYKSVADVGGHFLLVYDNERIERGVTSDGTSGMQHTHLNCNFIDRRSGQDFELIVYRNSASTPLDPDFIRGATAREFTPEWAKLGRKPDPPPSKESKA